MSQDDESSLGTITWQIGNLVGQFKNMDRRVTSIEGDMKDLLNNIITENRHHGEKIDEVKEILASRSGFTRGAGYVLATALTFAGLLAAWTKGLINF